MLGHQTARRQVLGAPAPLAENVGVWDRLHQTVPGCIDAVAVRAKGGRTCRSPAGPDRGKTGSEYRFLADSAGIPLEVVLSAGSSHGSELFEPFLGAAPAIRTPAGHAARRRGIENPKRLGKHHRVVERTAPWRGRTALRFLIRAHQQS
ncbi:hypothetical protein STBA_30080 [Streptomyces sp. MP131-18]|nr:hypothetical protein STBA_30080 [Streptomyces sp. MP131-18]